MRVKYFTLNINSKHIIMSGANDGHLVNTIMNQMEQENGPFDEEKGQFAKQQQQQQQQHQQRREQLHVGQMREKFINIIKNDPELHTLIDNSDDNKNKINEILNSEGLLTELFKDDINVNAVIRDILQVENHSPVNSHHDDQQQQQQQHQQSPQYQQQQQQQSSYQERMLQQQEISSKVDDFSFAEFMVGPILAAIAFFLVSNTPLLYFIGQIPYIGSLLVGNKLITSLVLVIGIYILGGFGIELVGLI